MGSHAYAPTGWIVGAYAAAPSRDHWDKDAELRFYSAVLTAPHVVGLELPWRFGSFHGHDEQWLFTMIPERSQLVVTTAPDTSARHRASNSFGLASADRDGRREAIEATRQLCSGLQRLRDSLPSSRIIGIELHSAPRAVPGASSREALRASLEEIASWDWGDAQLLIEHCDAWVPSHKPAKGYLSLADEVAVIQGLRSEGKPFGISLNWGRSAIEQRDADGGRAHAAFCASAGVLDGVVFSGAASAPTPLGGAWADVHAGFADDSEYASSVLHPQHVKETFESAGSLRFQGVKVAAAKGVGVEERVNVVEQAIARAQRAVHPE